MKEQNIILSSCNLLALNFSVPYVTLKIAQYMNKVMKCTLLLLAQRHIHIHFRKLNTFSNGIIIYPDKMGEVFLLQIMPLLHYMHNVLRM